MHAALHEARTLTEDYEQALEHLLIYEPAFGTTFKDTVAFEEYLSFRQGSLHALLTSVRAYLSAVRNCEAMASGQGLHFDYVAGSGGLLNGKFYDYCVHEWAYREQEPAVYALIVAYQALYSRFSQKITQLAA